VCLSIGVQTRANCAVPRLSVVEVSSFSVATLFQRMQDVGLAIPVNYVH
jgi:hypothetical protein